MCSGEAGAGRVNCRMLRRWALVAWGGIFRVSIVHKIQKMLLGPRIQRTDSGGLQGQPDPEGKDELDLLKMREKELL